jgi:HSP20 family protein
MPNFFKKLTGALKMPEEEDLFGEKGDENDKGEIFNETVEEEPAIEEEGEQDSFGSDEDGESTSDEELEETDTLLGESEEEDDIDTEGDADEEIISPEAQGGMSEGEKPFTIAQLARAETKKSAQPKRFSALRIKKEKGEDGNEGVVGTPEGQLAIDVYETDSEIVLKSTIAGVKPEDLDIGIEDSTVNIRGSRHQEGKVKGDNYFYQECYWGTFSRSVILPVEVDSGKVKASLKDGILTVRLPKVMRAKETKIKVLAN